MLAAINAIATCFLIVGVGIAHGDVLTKDSRSVGNAPIIAVKPTGSDATCRRGRGLETVPDSAAGRVVEQLLPVGFLR